MVLGRGAPSCVVYEQQEASNRVNIAMQRQTERSDGLLTHCQDFNKVKFFYERNALLAKLRSLISDRPFKA